MKPTMGSLFAGVGGFDLGFERAGFTTSWQVEINEYCRKVLAKHFPHAERYADIRECGAHNLKPVDVICGGFPCQDISNAGLRAGIDGERSGLWREMHRVIRELRPRFVVVENVAALLGRGMGRVLGDLSEIGYDAEWQVISAADVGAPHLRERVWITAYPNAELRGRDYGRRYTQGSELRDESCGESQGLDPHVAYASSGRFSEPRSRQVEQQGRAEAIGCGEAMADAERQPAEGRHNRPEWRERSTQEGARDGRAGSRSSDDWWAVEPNVGRVAHGVPARVDRLRALGNAVVPQIPELIARRLKECS